MSPQLPQTAARGIARGIALRRRCWATHLSLSSSPRLEAGADAAGRGLKRASQPRACTRLHAASPAACRPVARAGLSGAGSAGHGGREQAGAVDGRYGEGRAWAWQRRAGRFMAWAVMSAETPQNRGPAGSWPGRGSRAQRFPAKQ